MNAENKELSKAVSSSIAKFINKRGAIGLSILIVLGTMGLYGFYYNTDKAIEAGAKERVSLKTSVNEVGLMARENQIQIMDNEKSIEVLKESLERVIQLQLLILEKIE